MIYSEFFRPFIVIPFNTKSYKKIEIKFVKNRFNFTDFFIFYYLNGK